MLCSWQKLDGPVGWVGATVPRCPLGSQRLSGVGWGVLVPGSPLLPPQPPSLSPQASPGAALELGKMGDGDTSTPPENSAAPQRRTLPAQPGSAGGAAASPVLRPYSVGMLVMGGGQGLQGTRGSQRCTKQGGQSAGSPDGAAETTGAR